MSTATAITALSLMGVVAMVILLIEKNNITMMSKKGILKYTGITAAFYVFTVIFQFICSKFGVTSTNGLTTDDVKISFGYMFIYVAIFTPILEEFIFRFVSFKFMYFLAGPKMNERVRDFTVIVVSAFLFSCVHHGGTVQNLYAFIMGLLFGTVYTKEKNILTTTYMHFLFNGITVIIYVIAATLQ